jgi:hypothetical protein
MTVKTLWFGRRMVPSWGWVRIIDMRIRPGELFSLLQSKVARRMLAIFMLCALLPVCVVGGLSLWQVSRKLQTETYQAASHASKNAGMSVLEALSIVRSELETIADTQAVREEGRWPERRAEETGHEARLIGLTFYGEGGRPEALFGEACPRPVLTDLARAHLASGKALLFVQKDEVKPRILMAIRAATRGSGGSPHWRS